MKTLWVAAGVFLAGALPAQDELDQRIVELAGKLAREGPGAALADIMPSDAGRQAVREKIDLLVAARTDRFDRDPQAHYENYLFTTDADGLLRLRPERSAALERLRRALSRVPSEMTPFHRRAEKIIQRLAGDGEMEKLARAAWIDSDFRAALFHRHAGDLREYADEDLLGVLLTRGLDRVEEGRLRINPAFKGEIKERVAGMRDQLNTIREFEKAYLKKVAGENNGETRRVAASDAGMSFILGRLVRQVSEGEEHPIGGLLTGEEDKPETRGVSFGKDLSELLDGVRKCTRLADGLKVIADRLGAALGDAGPDELELRDFLSDDRARFLLAERMMTFRENQAARADAIFEEILRDGFEADGEALKVKKGRYVDDRGKDNPDVYSAEVRGVKEELSTAHSPFAQIAERCADSEVARMFEGRMGTHVLEEEMSRAMEELKVPFRKEGFAMFVRAYFVEREGLYAVRPDRELRVFELLSRAKEIQSQMDAERKAAAEAEEKGK